MKEVPQGICGPHMNENVSQENPKDRLLLEYDGDQLCGLCEELP